jgi:hypothetical protein
MNKRNLWTCHIESYQYGKIYYDYKLDNPLLRIFLTQTNRLSPNKKAKFEMLGVIVHN